MRFRRQYTLYSDKTTKGKPIWYFRIYLPDGTRRAKSTGCTSKEKARAYVENLLHNESRRRNVFESDLVIKVDESTSLLCTTTVTTISSDTTFLEFATPWWDWDNCPYVVARRAAGTEKHPGIKQSYVQSCKMWTKQYLIPFFGKYKLKDISPDMINSFWKFLKDMETSIGSVAYAQEYMSRALSDEDRLFRKEWIRVVPDAEVPRALARYEGIDPATGAHDLSAVVDIGFSKEEGRIYVLSSHGRKESTETFKQRLIQRYIAYRYRRAGMEAVAFQNVYRQEIVRDAAKRGLSLPLKAMNPGRGSKVQRDMMLSPLIENGTIVFCQGNDDLIDQLLEFPTGRYDDLVDALYYAVKVSGMKGLDWYDADEGGGADELARMRRMLNI